MPEAEPRSKLNPEAQVFHLCLADRMTELLWQVQLRQLRVQVNKDRRKVVCDVHVPEGFELPGSVCDVLGLGPKIAQATKRSKPELLSIVREVSKKVPEQDAARMNSKGLDALVRCTQQS
ncbi:hypothetical protein MTO96_051177 [Rhipicephalus appendiculatus]